MHHFHRRDKAFLLMEELPKLEKLVKKGKKLTPEIIEDRQQKARLSLSSHSAVDACGIRARRVYTDGAALLHR